MKTKKTTPKNSAVKTAVTTLLTATGIPTVVRMMCCCSCCPCC